MTYELAIQLKDQGKNVIPGWQLCRSCFEDTKKNINDNPFNVLSQLNLK